MDLEPFVDAQKAAEFLGITRRRLLELARKGMLPGHPLGNGKRRVWRFRFSELADSIGNKVVALDGDHSYGLAHKAVLGSEQEQK
jgi:helix-turn-helix protein